MITVVFDTSVIVSAIFWPHSSSRRVLAGLACRQYAAAVSAVLLDEYAAVAARLQQQFPRINPAGALAWLQAKCFSVEPAALGKQRSRDAKDDPVLATALAAGAQYLVARDKGLLSLRKPFGITIITPAEFLRQMESFGAPDR